MNQQNRPASAIAKLTNASQAAALACAPKGMESKPQPSLTRPEKRTVRLELDVPKARSVYVVGTFNKWKPGATPLIWIGGTKWFKDLPLARGRYEYRFVVNGTWIDDPKGKAYVPNPQGGRNAVLQVI
jgi:1,4-alpha-glucan branching enzyme